MNHYEASPMRTREGGRHGRLRLVMTSVLVACASLAVSTNAHASHGFDASSRANFTGVTDGIPGTVIMCGPDLVTVCANPAATEITWGTGLQGPTSMAFVPSTALSATDDVGFGQVFPVGVLSHRNTEIQLATSDVTAVELTVQTTIRDDDGSPVLVTGVLPITLQINETINANCTPKCPDTVVSLSTPSDFATSNGGTATDYRLRFLGFRAGAGTTPGPVAFITPEDGGVMSAELVAEVVRERPPVVTVGDYVVPEGSSILMDDIAASDPDGTAVTYSWSPTTKLTNTSTATPTFIGPDDAVDIYTVTVTDQAGKRATATTTVTTYNVAPVTNLGDAAVLDEHDTFERMGLVYSDVGVLDSHTGTVDYGDGTGPQPLTLTPGLPGSGTGTFDLSHQYLDDDPSGTPQDTYTVTVTITDDDGGSTIEELPVTVRNVDPTFDVRDDETLDEGQTLHRTISFDDIGTLDVHYITADYGEGDGFEAVDVDQTSRTFTLEHTYADDDPTATPQDDYTVTVRVADDDTGSVTDTLTVTVHDIAPDLSISAPSFDGDLFAAPATVSLIAPFTDPGVRDTFVCTIDWDEADATNDAPASPTEFVAPFSGTSGNCGATNVFERAGVYTVRVQVTDDDTLFDVVERTIVVYDPSAGFVTGGGLFDSPAGALIADPTAVGPATFGFVSMYRKGVAEGSTEFQFRAGDINFHSNDYEWLVVTGNATRAQYKGYGTINGIEGYGFILTGYDLGEPGSGTDRIRMKIWNATTDELVYDSRLGVSDDVDQADPGVITQGNIVIHTRGGKQ